MFCFKQISVIIINNMPLGYSFVARWTGGTSGPEASIQLVQKMSQEAPGLSCQEKEFKDRHH